MSLGANEMSPLAQYINMTYPPARSVILYPRGMGAWQSGDPQDIYDGVTGQLLLSGATLSTFQVPPAIYPGVSVWDTASINYGPLNNSVPALIWDFPYNTPSPDKLVGVPAGTDASLIPLIVAAEYNPSLNPGSQVNNPTTPSTVPVVSPVAPGVQIGAPGPVSTNTNVTSSTGLAPQGNPILSPAAAGTVTNISPLPSPTAPTPVNTLTPAIPATLQNQGTTSTNGTVASTCSGFQFGSTCIDSTMLLIGGAAVVALLMFTGKK
jgi:hypothetical protein